MRNQYLKNLSKIEFVITNACTGRCKHCSAGEPSGCLDGIDPGVAAAAVCKIAVEYDIQTVMAFGGEPLLRPDAVYAVMSAAMRAEVPHRQVITNGYFSKDPACVRAVASELARCGVNDLLLSVDAFHQETIPLDAVKAFAAEAKGQGIPVRLSPAWLVSEADDNPYNRKTREILDSFSDMNIPIGVGNVVFPEGNALKYLGEYFTDTVPENPYVEDPYDVRCVSFSAEGNVLDGNVCLCDVMEIIKNYTPQ